MEPDSAITTKTLSFAHTLATSIIRHQKDKDGSYCCVISWRLNEIEIRLIADRSVTLHAVVTSI